MQLHTGIFPNSESTANSLSYQSMHTTTRRILEENSLLWERHETLLKRLSQEGYASIQGSIGLPTTLGLSGGRNVVQQGLTTGQGARKDAQRLIGLQLLFESELEKERALEKARELGDEVKQAGEECRKVEQREEAKSEGLIRRIRELESQLAEQGAKLKIAEAEKSKFENLYKLEITAKNEAISNYSTEMANLRSRLETVYQNRIHAIREEYVQNLDKPDTSSSFVHQSTSNSLTCLKTVAKLELDQESLNKQIRDLQTQVDNQLSTIDRLQTQIKIEKDMRQIIEAQKSQIESSNLELITKIGGLAQTLPSLVSGLDQGGLIGMLKPETHNSEGPGEDLNLEASNEKQPGLDELHQAEQTRNLVVKSSPSPIELNQNAIVQKLLETLAQMQVRESQFRNVITQRDDQINSMKSQISGLIATLQAKERLDQQSTKGSLLQNKSNAAEELTRIQIFPLSTARSSYDRQSIGPDELRQSIPATLGQTVYPNSQILISKI